MYLDYAASAPIRACAIEAIDNYRKNECACANPNSLHSLGRQASNFLEQARREMAGLLGGNFRPQEITFTSGGTIANNIAVMGLADGVRNANPRRGRIIISSIEHDSILNLVSPLKKKGFEVQTISPNKFGFIEVDKLKEMLDRDVALVSIMAANNETGCVMPIDDLAIAAHGAGAIFHSDAVQAFGHVPLKLDNVDALTIAGHKFGAPLGCGVLAKRRNLPFLPILFGGGQEGGVFPGTQDVEGALALVAAAKECINNLSKNFDACAFASNEFYKIVCADGTGIYATTTASIDKNHLPGTIHVLLKSVDSNTAILVLDKAGYQVSAGSACASSAQEASHVLSAMGVDFSKYRGALRISFDERVAVDDIRTFAHVLVNTVQELGKHS